MFRDLRARFLIITTTTTRIKATAAITPITIPAVLKTLPEPPSLSEICRTSKQLPVRITLRFHYNSMLTIIICLMLLTTTDFKIMFFAVFLNQ